MIIYVYAFLTWIILFILAIINGGIRDKIYSKFTGELKAHQLSSITLSLIIFLVAYIFVNKLGFEFNSISLFLIGIEWLILTIIFEFIFGYYLFNHSFKELLNDYNFLKGRIWIIVLISILISPLIAFKI